MKCSYQEVKHSVNIDSMTRMSSVCEREREKKNEFRLFFHSCALKTTYLCELFQPQYECSLRIELTFDDDVDKIFLYFSLKERKREEEREKIFLYMNNQSKYNDVLQVSLLLILPSNTIR